MSRAAAARRKLPGQWSRFFASTLKWLRIISLGLLGLVAVAAFVYGLLQTALFRVERIDVTGTSALKPEAVIEHSSLKLGESVAFVPTDEAARRIRSLPWVKSVEVTRVWPHGVRIAIEERRPVGIAKTTSGAWVKVADDGVVVESSRNAPLGFPVLLDVKVAGDAGATIPEEDKMLTTIARGLPDALRPKVTQIQRQDKQYRLGLNNGIVVVLGDEHDMGNKLMAASSVLSQTDNKKISVLDVQSPTMPIGTPRDGFDVNNKPAAPPTTASPSTSALPSASTSSVPSQREPSTSAAKR